MEKAEALWRSRSRQAEVEAARRELARLEQERSPDIDNEVRRVVLCRLGDDAATAASVPTKICSAGCGLAGNSRIFSKKQWSARAVRRCLACMKADVEPKLCAHGKGAFDCAACIEIIKREAKAEVAAEAEVAAKEREHKVSCQSVEGREASTDAAKAAADPSRSGIEKSDLFQAIHKAVMASAAGGVPGMEDSPIFLEFTKAVAAHTQYALNAKYSNLMHRLGHDILVHTPEQQMLDTIKVVGWVPSEERALFLKQYRIILEQKATSEQVTKSNQEMAKVKKMLSQYCASFNRETTDSFVIKLMEDAGRAYMRHRLQDQRVERRKCDVCERKDPTSAPRFMMCAGCGKRRYCSGICQEKDWRENGHKMTCAPISDFVCRVKLDCPGGERGYCDYCAETFCLDCEDLMQCDECGLYSCGSEKEHKFGPIDGVCPWIWGCEVCEKHFCERCRPVATCVICDMDFCDFCCTNCSICEDPICANCFNAREAKGLGNLCPQCDDVSGWDLVDGRWVKRPRAVEAASDALTRRAAWLATLAVGSAVDARRGKEHRWSDCVVTAAEADRLRVHFRGWENTWDRWLAKWDESRLQPPFARTDDWRASLAAGDHCEVRDASPPPMWFQGRVIGTTEEAVTVRTASGRVYDVARASERLCRLGAHLGLGGPRCHPGP